MFNVSKKPGKDTETESAEFIVVDPSATVAATAIIIAILWSL